ncbi:UDP-sugar pyrophosphorylase 1 [Hondaea fermentalgiana]|uniref:UTP-monosaccharide-1-phosphate uridylyltransferase n=1 Tax=Hondaea fermentalgiana TaxID=2315210 RepID=A0A2R5GGG5_9STRA|nr:UDP-sugar pyrophosphorylase 1 [Hondaea fermentalgiana]|eukprot:GBG26944.1 UDP-sugar pyrophosphorylase 1 [Hondaea fermentalgiana]
MDVERVDELGQGHLLEEFEGEAREALLEQLAQLDKQYPGGLEAYVDNAQTLLAASKAGDNPYDGYVPAVPLGERLQTATSQFDECEELGMKNVGKTGFVLVAGGLGERLGYNGIKVALPHEIITGKCFLEVYCASILALQERARSLSGDSSLEIPLAIMTSGDTHEKTVELLHKHGNFGMAAGQITLMKQEKVPAIVDNEGHFAQEDDGLVATKPHGHGDVHSLLHSTGTLDDWKERGIEWVVFFQDTNGIVFRALPSAIGVSAMHNFDVNSLTVPRRPGEAVGGICQLDNEETGKSLTINVEYNQLDPLLRATTSPEGDVADETGYSPYPGNINVLIFRCESYHRVLSETGGAIPEFVNPKYADEEKTKFKKPTRLECMMQDYPKLLADDPDAKVGFTQMERSICFSAVKNNPADALGKLKSSGFAESASSGESDVYAVGRLLLAMAGVQIKTADIPSTTFLGLPFPLGAKVVLCPSFGTTVKEIRERFVSPENVKISERSSLVLDGDIFIENLDLDGDLRVIAAPGAKIHIKNLTVRNEGVTFTEVDADDMSVDEIYRIRGYVKEESETMVIQQSEPGETVIDRK